MRQVSATTGMPHVLVRRNMEKIRGVLADDGRRAGGLTRGLDLRVLDDGFGEQGGHALSFFPRAAVARRRAAEQLARRPLAVDAGRRARRRRSS